MRKLNVGTPSRCSSKHLDFSASLEENIKDVHIKEKDTGDTKITEEVAALDGKLLVCKSACVFIK